ncbi:alpha-amylase family glycosyl hydrolase [Thermoproteus tenax]|uniref:Glycosidase n=1 Tax=Thermoproteus tenax (strain ATCC 35583 / DSM 2078 / JCM 9277 / NBRC 100435 / Kra 1) TaxID=768679 RepID=G4RLC0_THETK|nr:alpha-amylase family glycosyl hydrolase [Thermoproteus tenax]CCC82365.1 glycosidase [Thermoproteus tenax Kra 1]
MDCAIKRWAPDWYFGVVAEVEVCSQTSGRVYLVSSLTGGLEGGLPLSEINGKSCTKLRLPPGSYSFHLSVGGVKLDEVKCNLEPPGPLLHAPSPYYVGTFGDEVEVRVYAVEEPIICGERCGRPEPLARVGRSVLYKSIIRGPPYYIACCNTSIRVERVREFPRPRWAPLALYEVMPDRVKRRLDCRDLRRDFCGGTLRDIADMVEYIAELADAIYLHPIYPAMSYHRYDVLDHKDVDDILGGLEAYEELRARAKSVGLSIVLDVVLHHVGLKSRVFNRRELFFIRDEKLAQYAIDIARSLPRSQWAMFFRGSPPYETFMSVWTMPRLDYSKEEALQYAKSVLAFWSDRADGFRFDVAHGIPPWVWEKLLGDLRMSHYLLAEHTGDPTAYLGVHHGFTAYELYEALIDFFALDRISADDFASRIRRYLARVAPSQLRYMYTFIENHDTDRFCSLARDPRRAVMAYAFIFSMPGIPGVYAGGEHCAEGLAADHTNRRPLDDFKPAPALMSALTALYRLRRRYPQIAEGPVREVRGKGELLVVSNGPITLTILRRGGLIEIKTPEGFLDL